MELTTPALIMKSLRYSGRMLSTVEEDLLMITPTVSLSGTTKFKETGTTSIDTEASLSRSICAQLQ